MLWAWVPEPKTYECLNVVDVITYPSHCAFIIVEFVVIRTLMPAFTCA